jgi:hypothetical protein
VGVDPETGCYIKDMNQIRAVAGVDVDTPVIALDDRPDNILNGEAIDVVPYFVAVNLVEVARQFVYEWNQELEATYRQSMQANWQQYLRNPSQFTVAWKDTVLVSSAASVRDRVRVFVA